MTDVPDDIPDDAKEVYLYDNRISVLYDFSFDNLLECEVLDLHSNDIFMIYNNSFSLLVKLQRLSLGKNNLKLLEIDTFRGLYSLQVLDLSDNSLLSLEPCIFTDIPRPFSLMLLGKEDSGTFYYDTSWCWLGKEFEDGTILMDGEWESNLCKAEGIL